MGYTGCVGSVHLVLKRQTAAYNTCFCLLIKHRRFNEDSSVLNLCSQHYCVILHLIITCPHLNTTVTDFICNFVMLYSSMLLISVIVGVLFLT